MFRLRASPPRRRLCDADYQRFLEREGRRIHWQPIPKGYDIVLPYPGLMPLRDF